MGKLWIIRKINIKQWYNPYMMQIWLKYENYNAKFMYAFYMHQCPRKLLIPLMSLGYGSFSIASIFAGSMICLKRIYNFWVIHASFVMSSHVSITILHHFYAFCWTNLLTRCLVPVPCFCFVFVAESYFWKYSQNWTKIYGDFLLKKWGREPEGRP